VFDDPDAEKTFHTLLHTAEVFVDRTWIRDPLTGRETSQKMTTYTTGWRSASKVRTNPSQSPQLMQEERHVWLAIKVDRNRPLDANDYVFEATHLSETDWGLVLQLIASDSPAEPKLQIRFFHPQLNTTDRGGRIFTLDWPNPSLEVSTREGNAEYTLSTDLPEAAQQKSVQAWRKQMDSPEAFRDELLGMLDQLQQETPNRIAAGQLIHTDWTNVSSANPPRDMPLSGPLPAPFAMKLTALADKEIGRRRQIVEQHYRAMHSALLSVFPLQEALGEESSTTTPAPVQPSVASSVPAPAAMSPEELAYPDEETKRIFACLLLTAANHRGLDWQHQPFEALVDDRHNVILYSISWTSPERFLPQPESNRRIMRATGRIEVTMAAERHTPTQVRLSNLQATSESQNGWGAMISYPRFRVMLYHHRHNTQGEFDHPYVFTLPDCSITASVREAEQEFRLDVSNDPSTFETDRWIPLFDSPESFQEAALSLIEQCRNAAREKLEKGPITRTDHTNASSAEPPVRSIVVGLELAPKIKQQLLSQIEEELDRRKQLVKKDFAGMHAALRKAFPLDECLCGASVSAPK